MEKWNMIIGYARQSTTHQKFGLQHQLDLLTKEDCGKIYEEEVSSVGARPEFESAIEYARDGDTFIVSSLSRFARSITDLWKNINRLQDKGVTVKILDMNLDTSTPTGRLLLSLVGSIHQWERETLLERQRWGIEKAKLQGKFKGRVPTARRKTDEIKRLHQEGLKPSEIATQLDIGVASVYRYRNAS